MGHCGACGSVCPTGGSLDFHGSGKCEAGACKITCSGAWANCNGNPKDGCEANLSDPNHCGTCDRVCDSGCNNGTCKWTQLVGNVSSPGAIALDSANVYFAAGTSIYKVGKGGGTPTPLASIPSQSGPGEIVVDATRVYFTDATTSASAIRSVPIAGGTVTTHGTAAVFKLKGLALSPTHVFWSTGFDGSVETVPIAGGAKVTLASGQQYTSGLAFASGALYFGEAASPGGLWKHDLGVGSTPVKLSSIPQVSELAVANGTAYFAGGGGIHAMPVAGGTATQLASASGVLDIACDGKHVYWNVDNNGTSIPLYRVPVGGGAVFNVASYLKYPTRIAVDDTHIYWTDITQNDVKRVSK
jgi:hypothetical protein